MYLTINLPRHIATLGGVILLTDSRMIYCRCSLREEIIYIFIIVIIISLSLNHLILAFL